MTFDQADFDVKCEWGAHGVRQLAPVSDVVVIIDVLSIENAAPLWRTTRTLSIEGKILR